jgi:hypothetical protein
MALVTANNNVSVQINQALSFGIGQTSTLPVAASFRTTFNVSGVLADQCDLLHAKTYTLVASTPQTIDLTALLDPVGAAVVFARVRLVAIRVKSITDGAVLLLGASGANDWTGLVSTAGTVKVYASSALNDGFTIFQMPNTTGAVVTSAGQRLVKLDPGTNAMLVDILIAGCSV